MARVKKAANPFYVMLVIVGVAFAISACAFGVMTVIQLDPNRAANLAASEHPLIQFLDRHGVTLLAGELAVLAVATFAAIASDSYWTRRAEHQELAAIAKGNPLKNDEPDGENGT